jgi:hypothetical protein
MASHPLLLASRYVDAVKNMRAKQLAYRVRRLVPVQGLAAGIGEKPPPGWQPAGLGIGVEVAPSTGPRRPPHRDAVFRAFGIERSADDPALWSNASDGLLFLFHLHGFQDLADYAASTPSGAADEFWSQVTGSWLERCGNPVMPAWHPYPMSGRIIAWCAALSRPGLLDDLRDQILANLWRQLRTLRRAVEHDIGGNHVLRNAAALVVGGVCLRDADSRRRGMRLLQQELPRQILADGGHEERSPSYHRLVLGDVVDVATVLRRARCGPPHWLTETIEKMHRWLRAIAGPAGDVPPLNDGWDGPPIAIAGTRPDVEPLIPSGYLALREGATQAVLDVAPVSPAHLPAHAHADVLAVVLWADGLQVLIDPGSYTYSGPERARFRGTAAHNTVQVDGADQCDFWGDFRAAGLPRVQLTGVDRQADGAVVVTANHDGYKTLSDPVVHERTYVWLGADGIVVLDRLLCRNPHQIASRLHFAPGIEAPLEAQLPGGLRFFPLGNSISQRSHGGARSPFIGAAEPIEVIEMGARVQPGEPFGWMLTRDGVDLLLEENRLDVVRPGGSALRINLPEHLTDR